MPFAKAADLLASFTHTSVSESTAQRLTEAIGLAYEAVQLAEVERIERDWPEVEHGPDKVVYVDGTGWQTMNSAAIQANGTFNIGRVPWCEGYFSGSIDDVRVYNRALSQGEIEWLAWWGNP